MLRDQACPHCGWSAAAAAKLKLATALSVGCESRLVEQVHYYIVARLQMRNQSSSDLKDSGHEAA
jgi:hypothetical protein